MSDYASTPSRPASPVGELPSFSAARPNAYRFNWDPATRRPGPESVSGTTEGRGDYFANNAQYDIYGNVSFANLALGTLPTEWSSTKLGFNVPPADLPRVRRKDFDSYLPLLQNAEEGRDGVAQIESSFPLPSSSIEVPPTPHTPRTPRPPPGKAPPPLETTRPPFPHSLPYWRRCLTTQTQSSSTRARDLYPSTSFFAALANLQDLQTESEQCLDRGKTPQYGRGEGRHDGVARSLVAAGHEDAKPTRPPPLPVKNGRSSPLPTVMESPPATPPHHHHRQPPPTHLTMEITSSLSSEFVNLLRQDLVERIDSKWEIWSETRRHDFNMSLKDRLRPLLQSLVRTKGILEATLSWATFTIKRRIPMLETSDDDSIPQQSNAAAELRAMSHSSFMDLSRSMYRSLLNCIEGLYRENAIIVEVIQGHRKASVDLSALQEELSDVLSSAAELANARASHVLGARAEQHTALDLPSFCALFNESWDFVVKSEIICRRMIVGLRGTIVSQAKSFLQHFHQTQLSQSAKLVEDEQWNAADVAPSVQRVVDTMVDASIQDPPELLLNRPPADTLSPIPPPSPAPPSPALTVNGAPSAQPRPSSPLPSPNFPPSPGRSARRRSANAPTKHLRVEDRPFFAVGATLDVLVLLLDYLKVIVNLPLLVTDTMSRVIELLKSFNSRTCQVVLGAGAMRSAGLKNITAKHLALASQSLAIMISLIPYIREAFRRHLSQKQAVMLIEFDKLKRDYQEHQNEIHAKLIAIMGDRLTAHIRSLQVVRWDVPKEGVNEYMEVLVKETVTLHKVLSRYLPSSVVEFVMTQVFAAINHRLSEEYAKIELPSLEAKERLLLDARYLQEKLTGLKNVAAPTAMLETVVSEKSVASRTAPLSAQPQPAGTPAPFPQAQQQQPAAPPVLNPGRFRGMLQRASTLNGRHATAPTPSSAPAPTPPVEKALPPPAVVVSPSPGPDFSATTPSGDPIADTAPTSAPVVPPPAPLPLPVLTEKPLVAEPEEANDDAPPLPETEEAAVDESPPAIPPKEDPVVEVPEKPHANGDAAPAAGRPLSAGAAS
ncbi:Vps54-like protein-domain-containing protein [Trametes gibbosa]|nr:Vps54-like protein-domain-containing protein [Trametes gibbosa]